MADNLIHQHEQILAHSQPALVSSCPTASSSTSGNSSSGDWQQHLDSRQNVPPQLHALQMPVHSFQHYHQQPHVVSAAAAGGGGGGDPSPSVFSSPTDSSPSGSPYHPDHLHYQHHHNLAHHQHQQPHPYQHHYDQRRRNSTFPLFLAQHTPVTPISIDPMEQHASGMSSTSYNPYLSPPSTTTLVGPTDRPHVTLPYLQSPTASYNYCPPMHEYGHGQFGGAGVGIHHRRRLSMLTPGTSSSPASSYPYQHPQYTHAHEAPDGTYAVLMGSYPPMEEPMKMGQYTPESPEAIWHQKSHYTHYGQQAPYHPPGQPQLLLANAMPTNAPIVIDDPTLSTPRGSIVQQHEHGYEYPSHATTTQSPSGGYGGSSSTSQGPFVPNVAVISTPAIHTATTTELTHVYPSSNNGINGQQEGLQAPPTSTVVGGGYNTNGTDMGIYANQTTASIVANGGSFTGQQPMGDGGPLPPILRGTAVTAQPSPARSTDLPSIARLSPHSQDQGSSINSSALTSSTSSSSTSNSVRTTIAAEASQHPVISDKAGHEQKQYVPKEENVGKEDQPRSHLSHNNFSDLSENALGGEKNNGDAIHHAESGKATGDTQQQLPELETTGSGATISPRTPVDQSVEKKKKKQQQSRHADDEDQPSDASTAGSEGRLNSTTVKSQIKDVAVVASLPQSTAPGQMEYGRYENTTVNPSNPRRVNCTGPGDLPNSLVGEVNTTGSTIKTPESNETKPQPLTYLAPTSDQGATINADTTSAPATTTTPTSDTVHHSPNIERSYSHPHPSSDEMQAISTQSYPHGSDAHHFSFSSSYTFPSRTGAYSSGSYNTGNNNNTHHHLPAVPSLLRPEWRRSSHSDYSVAHPHHHEQDVVSNFPRQSSISTEDGSNGRSLSPTPTPAHRNSVPNLPFKSEPVAIVGLSSPQTSPPQATGYHTPSGGSGGGRLVPAAFGNGTPGSASSASSTPPTALLDASSSSVPLYRYEGAAASSQPPLGGAAQAVAYGSPPDQKGHFDSSSSSTYSGFQAPPYSQSRGHESPYYPPPPPPASSYPHHHEFAYNSHGANYPRTFDSSRTRGSSSPAPPMIAGAKRGREDEWFADGDEEAREARRRRSSYAQSQAMIAGMHHYSNHSVAVSPSIPAAEMGVIRVSNYTPTLKDMGIGSVDTFSPLQDRMGNGRRAGDGAIRSGSDTSYSFISLPGNTVRKRPRRKFEEITRNYVCNWPGCTKAYGTLNHLNAHVTMQKHGAKRLPAEFKELRKLWRKQKREQAQRQAMRQDGGQMFPDDDGDDYDDDEKSVYNGVVEIMQ